jgi:hypothetical protein
MDATRSIKVCTMVQNADAWSANNITRMTVCASKSVPTQLSASAIHTYNVFKHSGHRQQLVLMRNTVEYS